MPGAAGKEDLIISEKGSLNTYFLIRTSTFPDIGKLAVPSCEAYR